MLRRASALSKALTTLTSRGRNGRLAVKIVDGKRREREGRGERRTYNVTASPLDSLLSAGRISFSFVVCMNIISQLFQRITFRGGRSRAKSSEKTE